MRLEPLYRVTLTTHEAWSVEDASDAGIEGRSFLLVHTTDNPRYRWLTDRVCAVEGEVRPRTDASGFEVVFEISEMVWEGVR